MNRKPLFAFLVIAHVMLAGVAFADDVPPDGREMSFRQVAGPRSESVPGGDLLIGAYAAIWALLGVYVFRMGRAQRALEADVKGLEKRVASLTRTGD